MRRRDTILLTATFIGYVSLVSFGVAVHEPWWDEAQAWLLARDAPIGELLTRDLAYEGHPPLWYLILAIPAKLHLPYKSINVVSALIGIAGVFLLLRLRRVPLAAQLVLPFTFYCAYQYTVVSRSYVLIPPLLFAILALYDERDRKIIPFALLLVALSDVSLYGVSLAAGLLLLFLIDLWRRRLRLTDIHAWKAVVAAALLILNTLVLAIILRLPADLRSRGRVDLAFSPQRILRTAWSALVENLIVNASEPLGVIAALLMVIVLVLWLWRLDGVVEFAILFIALLPVASVYFSPWHEGVFFWAMTFAVLLALSRKIGRQRIDLAAYAVLAIALSVQCWWTFRSLAYDVRENVTGSRDAATYIAAHGIERNVIFGAGVRCIELQPYFDRNLFANYHSGRPPSFWDWSERNEWPETGHAHDWMNAQLAAKPAFFLVSTGEDEAYKQILRGRSDYRLVQDFRGALFWKDSIFQPLNFELYARTR